MLLYIVEAKKGCKNFFEYFAIGSRPPKSCQFYEESRWFLKQVAPIYINTVCDFKHSNAKDCCATDNFMLIIQLTDYTVSFKYVHGRKLVLDSEIKQRIIRVDIKLSVVYKDYTYFSMH